MTGVERLVVLRVSAPWAPYGPEIHDTRAAMGPDVAAHPAVAELIRAAVVLVDCHPLYHDEAADEVKKAMAALGVTM